MFRNVNAEQRTRTQNDVWKYFKYSEKRAKTFCAVDFCSTVISGRNTAHLRRHLQLKHPLIYAMLPHDGVRTSERATADQPAPRLPNVITDTLRKKFKKKLKSIMESVLKSTVSEVTNAFDVFTLDHEIVVKQKMDECSMLRLKLEKAERKLREQDRKRGVREDLTQGSGQTISEITVDVPDDWCAPLGCENVMDQSPSTSSEAMGDRSSSLCSLSVALWRLPDIKQEVQDDGYQRDSSLSCAHSDEDLQRKPEHIKGQHKPLSTTKHGSPCQAKTTRDPKGSMKDKSRKQLRSDDRPPCKEKVKTAAPTPDKGSSKKKIMPAIKVEPVEDQLHYYRCKFCYKIFDTEVGRKIHIRTHKKCVDCLKVFRYPSNLRVHRKSCAKAKKASSPQVVRMTPKKEKRVSPRTTSPKVLSVVIQHEDRKQRAQKRSKGPDYIVQRRDKSFYCKNCQRSFCSSVWLRNHIRKNLHCSKCPKKFCTKQFLSTHIYEVHTLKLLEGLKPAQAVDMEFAALTSDEKPIKPSAVSSKETRSDFEAVSSNETRSKLDTVSSKGKQSKLDTVSSKEKHSKLDTVSSKEKRSKLDTVSSKEKRRKLDPVSSKEKQSKPITISSKENVGELGGVSSKEMQSNLGTVSSKEKLNKLSTVSFKDKSMEQGAVSSNKKLGELGAIPSNMEPIDLGAVSCTVKQIESVSDSPTIKQSETVSVSPTVKGSDVGAVSAYVKQMESFSVSSTLTQSDSGAVLSYEKQSELGAVSPKEKLKCEEGKPVLG